MIGALGGALLQNPAMVAHAASFAPRAPRAAAHLALRFAGVSGDDAAALQESGLPAWSLLLVGTVAGAVLGLAAAKRYPSLTKPF
jgi:hypothetical protein